MKKILCLFLFAASFCSQAQLDTLVIYDYTKIMVSLDRRQEVIAVSELDQVEQAGFFLTDLPDGVLRVCNSTPLFVWVNGRLLQDFTGCVFIDPAELFTISKSDSIFVSFHAKEGLDNLVCELVVFEKLQVLKEDPKLARGTRNSLNEFSISVILILLLLAGFFAISYPSRLAYIANRTFTFKISAYDSVNTNFLSASSLTSLIFLSALIGFVGVYCDQLLELGYTEHGGSYLYLLLLWFKLVAVVFGLFLLKWLLVTAVSKLFQFREINNYQLFDFINFLTVLGVLVSLGIFVDFIFHTSANSWIGDSFIFVFVAILVLFNVWFSWKFVNNSQRKKLLIISYLCATEIIPTIFIIGRFFK